MVLLFLLLQNYSQTSHKRTPLGPSIAVRLQEVSTYRRCPLTGGVHLQEVSTYQPRSQGFSLLNWVADPIQKGKALGTRLVHLREVEKYITRQGQAFMLSNPCFKPRLHKRLFACDGDAIFFQIVLSPARIHPRKGDTTDEKSRKKKRREIQRAELFATK